MYMPVMDIRSVRMRVYSHIVPVHVGMGTTRHDVVVVVVMAIVVGVCMVV